MTRLAVRFFGGESVGMVLQKPDGSLQVQGETTELELLLSSLIERITQEPVYLVTGREEQTKDGLQRVTVRQPCVAGHTDYLRAVADTLLSSKATLLNRRFRGEIEE